MSMFNFFRRRGKKPPATPVTAPVLPTILPQAVGESQEDFLTASRMISAQAQQMLLENASTVQAVYFIVDGCVLLHIHGKWGQHTLKFRDGEAFGLILQESENVYYSVISEGAAIVAELNHQEFQNVSDKSKNFLYEKIRNSNENIYSVLLSHYSLVNSSNKKLINQIMQIEQKRKEITASGLIQNVINGIPKLPAYTIDLLAKLLDENASIQEVTEVIRKDPPLTAAILKNVNSAYYGLQRKISSIHHAIAYLGFQNIYRIIVNDFMKNIIPNEEEFYHIQNHSIIISIISQELSSTSHKIKSTNPTTIGILHDIGKIILLLLKKRYQDIADFFDILDDSIIGAKLLAQWELPENVYAVVEKQRQPEFSPPSALEPEYKNDVAILYVAHVFYDILLGTESVSTMYLDDYIALFNFPTPEPQAIYRTIIVPALMKNRQRLPEAIRQLLTQQLQIDSA